MSTIVPLLHSTIILTLHIQLQFAKANVELPSLPYVGTITLAQRNSALSDSRLPTSVNVNYHIGPVLALSYLSAGVGINVLFFLRWFRDEIGGNIISLNSLPFIEFWLILFDEFWSGYRICIEFERSWSILYLYFCEISAEIQLFTKTEVESKTYILSHSLWFHYAIILVIFIISIVSA